MAWWDQIQQNIGGSGGGGSQVDTPPNLNWGDAASAAGDLLDQTAQYATGNPPDNLNWPASPQPGSSWFGNIQNDYQQIEQQHQPYYASNGYQLNQPDYSGPYLPQYMPQTPAYQSGLTPQEQSIADMSWANDWGYQSGGAGQPTSPLDVVNDVIGNASQGAGQPPNLNLAPANPDDYWGNIYRGIRTPAQQNALENNRQGKMPWDVVAEGAGNVAGGLLGGLGAAVQPIGGGVDELANSGIPGLSQYAQGVRSYFENAAQPVFNFTPSAVGDIARGQLPSVLTNFLSNLNPFDNYDQAQVTKTKLGYVQDAYNSAIANGLDDAHASQVAQNLDRSLSNFANLSEYAGLQKFGTLPALAQLGIMLADPVGNLGGEALLAGRLPSALTEGRLADATLGGRLGRTTLDGEPAFRSIGDIASTAQKALGYFTPMSQVGKAVGAIGDLTGLSGLLQRAGEALRSPLQEDTQYTVGAEPVIAAIKNYADANPSMPERAVLGEYLNNPESGIYHEAIGAPPELTDYLQKSYDYQPLDKGDPSLTPQQELIKPPESALGVAEQTVPTTTPAEAATFELGPIDPEAPFANQKSNYVANAISDLAEKMVRDDPKLNLTDAVEQARNSPDIQALRDTINTPEDLAAAREADAATRPAPTLPSDVTSTNAALDVAFQEALPPRPTRMPQPLPLKYTGVELPPAKGATIDEFYNTSRQLKGIDSGLYKRTGAAPFKPGLRTIKPLENIPVLGAPLRGWETMTHATFARPFLNTFSRLLRDPLGNLVKLGIQDPAGLAGYVTSIIRGGKDTTSRLYEKYNGSPLAGSTGHASASADVSFAHGAKSPLAQLWYVMANPHNEIPALAIRTIGKGLGKLDKRGAVGKFGREKLGQFHPTTAIEVFEQSVKNYQFKKAYVQRTQSLIRREIRKGTFQARLKEKGFEGTLPDEIMAHAVAGTLPKGADLQDYRDSAYNPSNFSPEKLAELNKALAGDAGPMGDFLKETFDALPDAIDAAKAEVMAARDKEVAIAKTLKNKKNADSRANTALANGQRDLMALDRISPDHPLVQKLWADARRQVDNSFTAQSAVAVSDHKLVAAYRQAALDTLDYAARTKDFLGLKQSIQDEIKLREPGYIQQYQKNGAAPTATAKAPQKPAATPKATTPGEVQQAVLDWANKRYIKYDTREVSDAAQKLDYEKHNKGRGIQQSLIKRWINNQELGGKAKSDRVLMYEPGHEPSVYWMSNKSKVYDPQFEVPRGKQEAAPPQPATPDVPREAQGKNGGSATTSGATGAVRDWLEVDNPTSIPAKIKTFMQKQGIWQDGLSPEKVAYNLDKWWMDRLEKYTNPPGAAGWNNTWATKKEPGVSSTQQANIDKVRTRNPSVGWKLHLTVDPANYRAVSDQLHSMLADKQIATFKAGKHGGQLGKDFTVYVGSKADAAKAADLLNSKVGHLIDTPYGLDDEVSFGGNVKGRFDLEHGKVDSDFASYGSKGVPLIADDVLQVKYGGMTHDQATARADKLLKSKYGKFYDNNTDIPTPATTRMPGKAPATAPVATAVDPARVQQVLQGYYDSFFKTGTAIPTYDFSAKEMSRAASGQGLSSVKSKILEADAKIREITGNRFQLDIDTMTPIGTPGSSYAGKHLTELVGRGKPLYKVEGPLPKSLPKEVADMEMPEMLDAVRQHYGEDALRDFRAMDPIKRDAILNELADTFLGVKAVDPLVGVDKASKEWQETHRLLDSAWEDIKTRYEAQKAENVKGREKQEGLQRQQEKNTQAILAVRNRIAIQAHAHAYETVKGTFFDYRNKNAVDQALGSILPYQYWARQNFAYAMRHFAAHPMHFAALLNFYRTLEKENADPNIPDYAKGDIFLLQNSDGSKVLWDFSSILPFNPLSSNDSVMQVVSPGDSTGRTIRNTTPLAILFGTDIVSATNKQKVTARDKGILPTFFRPNPILELAFKTGNVNNLLQALGIARGDQTTLGQDYPDATRAQKETSGFIPGNTFYQEIGAATGLSKALRGAKILPADLSPQSLIDERLFGLNAGKPQTKLIQELTSMAQRGEITPEQGKLAIAAYKEGNWTPEALKALDRAQGENATRRLLTAIGFTTIVVNTPRQQLANRLYTGLGAAYDGQGAQSIIGPDGKKIYVPSDASKYYTANPGASVLTSSGKSPSEIKQGLSDDKTRTAYSALVQQSIDKKISARDFNLKLAGLQASNPQYFVDHPLKQGPKEQLYNEQLQQYQSIGGDRYDSLSKRAFDLSSSGDKSGAAAIYNSQEYIDARTARNQFMADNPDFKSSYVAYLKSKGQDYKEPNPQEQKYFDQLAAYQSIGGADYDAKAKAVSDAYASGNTKLGGKLYSDPEYLKYKTAREVYLKDHPDFKAQYDAYNLATYGTKPTTAKTTTAGKPASTSSYSTARKTTSYRTTSRLPARSTGSSSSSSSSTYAPYTPAQRAAYASALAKKPGNLAYARAAAANTPPGGTARAATTTTPTTTRLPSNVIPIVPRVTTQAAPSTTSTSTSGYTPAQAQGYARAKAAGKSDAYAAAVARNIGLQQGTAPTTRTSLTKPIVNSNTIGYTNSGSSTVTASGHPIYYTAQQALAQASKAPTRLPARRGSGGGSRRSTSTRLPANAIRFSPGRQPRQPVRFG